MQRIACALWRDDSGSVVSAEQALVSTMATHGMVSGLHPAILINRSLTRTHVDRS